MVHRVRDEQSELGLNSVQVLVRKVRNKAAGQIGDTVFDYDRTTGQYWARDPNNGYLVPQWDQSQLSYYRSGFKGGWDCVDVCCVVLWILYVVLWILYVVW